MHLACREGSGDAGREAAVTMPGKAHRRKPRNDDWSQAMTWTIRMDTVPRTLNRRAAMLDRSLRLSQLERRRRADEPRGEDLGAGPVIASP